MARKALSRPTVEGVASAERTLQVLAAFRTGDGALELAELAERTGLVKSTIMRLAVSLERYGFLFRTLDGRYALGGEIARLADIYSQSYDLAQAIVPVLEYLVIETEETATFWVREGDERRCLFRVNSHLQLRLDIQTGTKRAMDRSGAAMVLRYYDKPNPNPPSEPPFYSANVATQHVASISAPVFGMGGKLVGSLTLSGPDARLTPARAVEITDVLLNAAKDLSRRLGGAPMSQTDVRQSGETSGPSSQTEKRTAAA